MAYNRSVLALIAAGLLLYSGCGGSSQPTASNPTPAVNPPAPTGHTQSLPINAAKGLLYVDEVGTVMNPLTLTSAQVSIASALVVAGWGADPEAKGPGQGVEVVIDGHTYTAQYGIPRGDVAAAYKTQSYLATGFNYSVPASQFGAGAHSVSVRVIAKDGKSYYESPTINVIIQ